LDSVGVHTGNNSFDGRSFGLIDRSGRDLHRSSRVMLREIGTGTERCLGRRGASSLLLSFR
jgi:hypothetical protein